MDPVKASPRQPELDPTGFAAQFADAARRAGFRAEPYGEVEGHPLVAYTKRTPGPHPRIYLSSGIHGDEPAPPQALLRLVAEGVFDGRATWFLCPLLNPTGFARSQRENFQGADLNRDYLDVRTTETRQHVVWLGKQPNFDLVLCLHEDWESQGFYLYELNPDGRPTLAPAMIEAARAHTPIEAATVIDGRPADEPGIIRPDSDPLLRVNWPEAIYLRRHHCPLVYTTETASAQPLAQRIATHAAVVTRALEIFPR